VKATEPEQAWRKKTVGKAPCILGLCGTDRDEMARSTFEIFKLSGDWRNADAQDQELFTEFIDTIYLAKLKHPRRDATFHYGDCLEPGFIASTLDRPDVWDVVLKLLKVK
jgi:hypothetical protein